MKKWIKRSTKMIRPKIKSRRSTKPALARRSRIQNWIRSRKLASKQQKTEMIIGTKRRRGGIKESNKGGGAKAMRGTVAHEWIAWSQANSSGKEKLPLLKWPCPDRYGIGTARAVLAVTWCSMPLMIHRTQARIWNKASQNKRSCNHSVFNKNFHLVCRW